MSAVDPAMCYQDYLGSFGIVDAGDRVAELRDLDLGRLRFFAYADGDSLRLKAAVTPRGIVTPGAHAGDDWYGFLSGMPDAASAADRIAWLETDESPPHGLPTAPTVALTAGHPATAGIDPAEWALVTAPTLHCSGGDATLSAWFLADGRHVPIRWVIEARAGSPAVIERAAADALVAASAGGVEAAAADAAARARRLLVAGTDDERHWALQHLGDAGHRAAVPDITALLADAEASPAVRLLAAGTLGRLADPAAVTALGAALRTDAAPELRRASAQALGRIGGATAVQALARAPSDELDPTVRGEIVHALIAQGSAAGAALARIARSDPSAAIRELAQGGGRPTGSSGDMPDG